MLMVYVVMQKALDSIASGAFFMSSF